MTATAPQPNKNNRSFFRMFFGCALASQVKQSGHTKACEPAQTQSQQFTPANFISTRHRAFARNKGAIHIRFQMHQPKPWLMIAIAL
jgi:hypothetical protein